MVVPGGGALSDERSTPVERGREGETENERDMDRERQRERDEQRDAESEREMCTGVPRS